MTFHTCFFVYLKGAFCASSYQLEKICNDTFFEVILMANIYAPSFLSIMFLQGFILRELLHDQIFVFRLTVTLLTKALKWIFNIYKVLVFIHSSLDLCLKSTLIEIRGENFSCHLFFINCICLPYIFDGGVRVKMVELFLHRSYILLFLKGKGNHSCILMIISKLIHHLMPLKCHI